AAYPLDVGRTMTYHELRQRFLSGLEAAAQAQESGHLGGVETGYRELDSVLPRTDDPVYHKLEIALEFWDGWIDARNHDWLYYEGIQREDWPRLARGIVDDLRQDREISDQRVVQRFNWRRRATRPSVWARFRRIFRGGTAV